MRIASLQLNDFLFIKDSGINELSVTFTEPVQIIIGSNGSGKSVTLRQLSPYPTVRSMFGKAGFKSLVLEKNGVYYKLDSEYEKPSSPHAFYEGEDEDNLNVGRTTETQKELIIEHLGITPLIDDLIMNRYVFPKMAVTKRKEFLMGVNPDQIGFVLTLIRQTSSKIKACKNNIARLQQRKILLEQELLDDESLLVIQQEKDSINKDLETFQQYLMDLSVGLKTLNCERSPLTLSDLPNIQKVAKRSRYKLVDLSHVNRDDRLRQLDRERFLSALAVCEQKIEEIDQQILEVSSELVELETQYRELSFEGDLKTIDDTVSRLETEREKLAIVKPLFELSKDELSVKYKELETLIAKLQIFTTLSVKLLSSKKRQRREQALVKFEYRQSSYQMRLNDLQSQYDDLDKRHKLKPSDIPDKPCAKEKCPLYSHFMHQYETSEDKRQSLLKALEKGHCKTHRLNRYVEGALTYFRNSKPYHDQLQWLLQYAQSNPILHHILRQMDILSVLSTNPNQIVRKLKDTYDRLDQWLKFKEIEADLQTAYALKSRQISSESHDTIKLVSAIENRKQTLYESRRAIKRLLEQKQSLHKSLEDIKTFSETKETMLTIQQNYKTTSSYFADVHERDLLNFLKKRIEDLRTQFLVRLSDIERTLRAQSSLKERYQEEVLSQLNIIDKELADLQQIEAALIVIPKENMIGFINTVFDQANRLIDSIWTVPLKLELLKPDDSLNYEFMVLGDNNTLREISDCSDGQTEILSLTINLALRIVLGHLNFPLCLDEPSRTLDNTHRQNLSFLLRRLLDEGVISQLFIVSHHAVMHDAFKSTETLVIRQDNIMLPEVFNEHCTIQ